MAKNEHCIITTCLVVTFFFLLYSFSHAPVDDDGTVTGVRVAPCKPKISFAKCVSFSNFLIICQDEQACEEKKKQLQKDKLSHPEEFSKITCLVTEDVKDAIAFVKAAKKTFPFNYLLKATEVSI